MTDNAVIPAEEDRDHRRSMALLKAVGLDKVPPEQRELALAIAKRYDLDLLLKHLVLIDGRPYITRDGLLWVAHRSGVFDGMEATDPELEGDVWRARCSVWRKDMSRPFTYAGRYPAKGGNQRFAPEMAVKVAEVMALRRAFNVSAPVLEERWDMDATVADIPTAPRPQPPSLRERIATVRAETMPPVEATITEDPGEGDDAPEPPAPPEPSARVQCPATSPYEGAARCRLIEGHEGMHKSSSRESWQ